MDNNKKNPIIRFEEFKELYEKNGGDSNPENPYAWEQRKFSDLIQTMRGGASIAPDDYKDKGIATVPKGAINSTGIADLSGSKYVSKEFFEKNKNSSVYSDELVTSLRDLVPSAPNMGRIVKLKGKDHRYLMPQGVYNLVLQDEVDENFLISFTNTSKFRKIISQEKNGSTQVHIRNSEYLGISIITPDSEEQNKIGSFFKQLDATIALQQRKVDKILNLKKAMLEKMFPKDGEKIPEVRFEKFKKLYEENGGDSNPENPYAWEQRKLGDITESYSGGTPSAGNKLYYGGNIPFIRSGEINDDQTELFITEDGLINSSAKMVSKGDILYALYGATSGEVGISKINGAINQAILAIKPKDNDDPYLITQWLKKQKESIIETYLQGGQGNLSGSIVKELTLQLPIDKNEQQKIGAFFKSLDDTIALQQHKLTKLKNIKKALLKKMFI